MGHAKRRAKAAAGKSKRPTGTLDCGGERKHAARGKRAGPLGPEAEKGKGSSFFFFSQAFSKLIFKSNSNHFKFKTKSHIPINPMHEHVCTNKLLNLIINFNLMKRFVFLYFHEHIITKLNHLNSISKRANFRVL